MHLPLAHVEAAFAPLELLPRLVAAALYAKRSLTLAAKGRPVPLWRQLCFGGGLVTISIALFSPIGHISEELVIAHMGEHLLLRDIAHRRPGSAAAGGAGASITCCPAPTRPGVVSCLTCCHGFQTLLCRHRCP